MCAMAARGIPGLSQAVAFSRPVRRYYVRRALRCIDVRV